MGDVKCTIERKKQRGQRRKLEALCRAIDGITPEWDATRTKERFRVGNIFIGHPKTYSNVKTEFCRKVIEKTEKIIAEKGYIERFPKWDGTGQGVEDVWFYGEV